MATPTPYRNFGVIAQAVTFFIVLGAAGYFGSVTANAQNYLLAATSFAGLLALVVALITKTQPPKPLLSLSILALSLVAWAIAQSLQLPASLNAWAYPLWQQAEAALDMPLQRSLSITPTETFSMAMFGITYIAWALFVGVATSVWGGSKILKSVALSSLIICLYGLIVYATGNSTVLFLPKVHYPESLSATFINRNSYATFAGLTLLINMAVFLEKIGELLLHKKANFAEKCRLFYNLTLKPRWPWLLASFIIFITLILSSSRAGVAWSFVGLILMLSLLIKRYMVLLLPTILGVAVIFFSLIGDSIIQRSSTIQNDSGARSTIYNDTLQAWKQSPLTGSGLGSFEEVFRIHKSPQLAMGGDIIIDRAHSTPLQMLLELGLVGMGFFSAILAILITSLIHGLRTRRSQIIYPALGLGLLAVALGHSFFDFSLEIPGVTILFIAALTISVVTSFKVVEKPRQSISGLTFAVIGLAVFSAGIAYAGHYIWKTHPYKNQLQLINSHTKNGTPIPTKDLLSLTQTLPQWASEPTIASHLAILNADLAQRQKNTALKEVNYNLSRLYAQQALKANPADPQMWHRLSIAEANLKNIPQAVQYWKISTYMGPWEPLAWSRIPYSVYLSNVAPAKDKPEIQKTVVQLWNAAPYKIWSTNKDNPELIKSLACMIQTDPEAITSFERLSGSNINNHLQGCNASWQHNATKELMPSAT